MLDSIRIGQGFDVHAFSPDRKLILAGIDIPHHQGLLGHSDADVLLHAVSDAVLGALAWGDIGTWFPDTSSEFKDISSEILFSRIWAKVSAEGWVLGNCDVTVMAERPKLAPYVPAMRERLAKLFAANDSQVSIKATTTEKLGFVGREEGIAATAAVLLLRTEPKLKSIDKV